MVRKIYSPAIPQMPMYSYNQEVYALVFSNDSTTENGKKKEFDEQDHARIFKAKIKAINIDEDGIAYWLKDPITNIEWGMSIPELQISTLPNDLWELMSERWRL
jgi:hypothetical protein